MHTSALQRAGWQGEIYGRLGDADRRRGPLTRCPVALYVQIQIHGWNPMVWYAYAYTDIQVAMFEVYGRAAIPIFTYIQVEVYGRPGEADTGLDADGVLWAPWWALPCDGCGQASLATAGGAGADDDAAARAGGGSP